MKCLGLTGKLKEGEILVSHCLLLARFCIFSCKYKSSKPSIVEYIYQVKDSFKIKKQFSIIKRTKNMFEDR